MRIQEQIVQDGKVVMIERDMTAEEELQHLQNIQIPKEQQIAELKAQLQSTDYKAIKYAEGWLTEEEYTPIKAERQAIRDRINELEGK